MNTSTPSQTPPDWLAFSTPSEQDEILSCCNPHWQKITSPAIMARAASNSRWKLAPHLANLNSHLTGVIDGGKRLIVTMPPRHGKSELVSKYTPAWVVGQNPSRRVILCSYEATFASSWGRKAREVLQFNGDWFPGLKLKKSPAGAENWETDQGGGMVTAGVGGPITGKGADLLIIDDPIKNAEEAASARIRENIWNWWTTTAYTRLEPKASVVLVQTRWHTDDLAGRLLADTSGEKWTEIKYQAINASGAPLWPARYGAAALAKIRRAIGEYHWSALYQQSPLPDGGRVFDRAWFTIVEAAPSEGRLCRFWDKAGSDTVGDWSAGVLMLEHGNIYYVVDVVHGRWGPFERNNVIRQTAEIDNVKYGQHRVQLWIEQEPGNGGKESAMISVRDLARFGPKLDKPHTDKVSRARPFSAQCEAGNVRLVAGPWVTEYLDELATFPVGAHDDQVDASSGAFNKLVLEPQPVAVRRPVSRRA